MTDPRDSRIDELFDRLRQIEPPIDTKIASREAVTAELGKLVDVETATRLPLWKRSVAIPIPVLAASVALMLIFAVLSFLANVQSTTVVDRDDQTVNDNVESRPNDGNKNVGPRSSALPNPSSPVRLAYHESTVYLCGIGPLRTESRSFVEE